MEWTSDQLLAIEGRGSIAVSAAAGSGKTAVLVERIIRRLTDSENPKNIDDFLIVTFTEAAASEMRSKILEALYKKIAENPEDKHIQKQAVRIGRARITTVHGFCMSLVKRYFQRLGLSPKSRIADEAEASAMKEEICLKIIEDAYEKYRDNPLFSELVEQLSNTRNDDGLKKIIMMVREKLMAIPLPAEFLQDALGELSKYESASPLSLKAGAYIKERALDWLKDAENLLKTAAEASGAQPDPAYTKQLEEEACSCKKLSEILEAGGYEAFSRAVTAHEFLPLRAPRGYAGAPEIIKVKALREQAKERIEKLASIFCYSEKTIKADCRKTRELASLLFEIINEFEAAYSAEKQARQVLDFSDLEHFALRLLTVNEGGKLAPSLVAKEIAAEIEEILVDEYQDTNELQDAIFNAVSRDGKNCFFVGDIKQSIYRFRQARPEIFLEKTDRLPEYKKGEDGGGKIILSSNFRSRKSVIEAINYIFDLSMSRGIGGSEYNGKERLTFAAGYDPERDFQAELDIIIGGDGEKSDDGIRRELDHVARRIRRMLDGGIKITDLKTGQERPAMPGDIAILMRTKKRFASAVRILKEYGINAIGEESVDFFAREEIMTMTSLLSVIDNPDKDVPLAAVMASPIFGFTPEELAEVRAAGREGSFYQGLLKRAESDKKCRAFIERIEDFRLMAAGMPADRLIFRLYEDTGYMSIVAAMEEGKARISNLRALYDAARRYEEGGFKGLFYFNSYIERVRESGGSFAGGLAAEREDAVKVITFHKAKGLEFPIVFVCALSGRFNRDDVSAGLLADRDLGIAMRLKDTRLMAIFDTYLREIFSQKALEDSRSEELRTLYVALTRAKEKLILTSFCKIEKNGLSLLKPSFLQQGKLTFGYMLSANSQAEWVLGALQHHPLAKPLCERFGINFEPAGDTSSPWQINLVSQNDAETLKETENGAFSASNEPDDKLNMVDKLTEEISKRFAFEGPEETAFPAKLSVSRIKAEVRITKENAAVIKPSHRAAFSSPAFLKKGTPLTPAQKGTAIHEFLRYADFRRISSEEEITEALEELRAAEFISKEQAEAVNIPEIIALLGTTLIDRIRKSPLVYREKRFNILLPVRDVKAFMDTQKIEDDGESVIVQGVFDCVFYEDGEPVLVDYKTDKNVSEKELAARYALQLEIYDRALFEITGKRAKQRIIYSFFLGREIIV